MQATLATATDESRHWAAGSDASLAHFSTPPHITLVTAVGERLPRSSIVDLADAMEMDCEKAEKAVRAAVPILLACLSIVASRPAGAQRLARLLARRQPVEVEVVTDAACHGGQRIAAAFGVGVLRELLGNQAADSLRSSVADFSGLARHHAGLMLGAVTVVVVDILVEYQRGAQLSARKLAGLFSLQSDSIIASIPPGFSSRGTGLLGHLSQPGADRRQSPMIIGKVEPRAVQRFVPDAMPADGSAHARTPMLTFVALALLMVLFIAGLRV